MKIRTDTLEPRLRSDGCTEVWGAADRSETYHWVATFATDALAWRFINAVSLPSSSHVEIEPVGANAVPRRESPVKLTYDQVVSLYHPHEFVGIAEFYRAGDYQAILSQLAQANAKIARMHACPHVELGQPHCRDCAEFLPTDTLSVAHSS